MDEQQIALVPTLSVGMHNEYFALVPTLSVGMHNEYFRSAVLYKVRRVGVAHHSCVFVLVPTLSVGMHSNPRAMRKINNNTQQTQ